MRTLWTFILRLFGYSPSLPSSSPSPRPSSPASPATADRARRVWSRTRISVWREDTVPGYPLPGYRRASDTVAVTGFASAMSLARYHAGEPNGGPGFYLLNVADTGDQIARVEIDADGLLHVVEWCDEELFQRHERLRDANLIASLKQRQRAA